MPNLARFMDEGVRAKLLSTRHPLTPPAWTTLMTGREPGSHGIFDFIWAERRGQEVYFTLNNFRDIQVETVWSMVSRAGGRATSLNYPLMAPPPEINGTVIPGLVSWKHLRRSIHPKDLYDRLKELPGFNPKEVAWDFDREKKATKVLPRDEIKSWVEHHLRREKQWYQIFEYLQSNRPSDLTGILLDGVDKLQHICWRHLDPDCSATVADDFDREVQQLAQQYFKDLDKFFDAYHPRPSLLHGDLWSGNYGGDLHGEPVIYDPACYYGDHEADLAMMELFGHPGERFFAIYAEMFPIDPGYSLRRELYNLYHILNHALMFGGAYEAQALRMTNKLLAQV